jgi:hypothetical protein
VVFDHLTYSTLQALRKTVAVSVRGRRHAGALVSPGIVVAITDGSS